MGIVVDREREVVEESALVGNEKRSGRAVWDSRGNSIWEWQTQPGVFSRDIDTIRLKALAGELTIQEEEKMPRMGRRR